MPELNDSVKKEDRADFLHQWNQLPDHSITTIQLFEGTVTIDRYHAEANKG